MQVRSVPRISDTTFARFTPGGVQITQLGPGGEVKVTLTEEELLAIMQQQMRYYATLVADSRLAQQGNDEHLPANVTRLVRRAAA